MKQKKEGERWSLQDNGRSLVHVVWLDLYIQVTYVKYLVKI